MTEDLAGLEAKLRTRFPDAAQAFAVARGTPCIQAPRERVLEILRFLRDDPSAQCTLFTDLTAVDRLRLPPEQAGTDAERFAVVYHLTCPASGLRVRVKALVPEDPAEIASAVSVFAGAAWAEREVFDMFGIRFTGHPDLRRILMPEEYSGFPLRKDYPLKGRGERDRVLQPTDGATSHA